MSTRYSWRNFHPTASLHYIKDAIEANTYLATLTGPVGFDLEWRPSFKKGEPEHPVALVQLANSDSILLIQISQMSEFPQSLREFLEDPKYPKAGVGIQYDAKKIFRDCQVSVRNCVDLSLLARSVDNARWKGKYRSPLGLARLIETYEDSEMPKGKIARTNWELNLSDIQAEYAANDAHAGFLLYDRLFKMAAAMEKTPDLSCYCFDSLQGIFYFPSNDSKYWAPHNPDYDPGPPPPPRPPKDQAAGVPVSSSSPTSKSLITGLNQPSSPNSIAPSQAYPVPDISPRINVSRPSNLHYADNHNRTYRTPARDPRDPVPRSSRYSSPPPTRRSGQALSQGASSSAISSHSEQPPRRHAGVNEQGTRHEGERRSPTAAPIPTHTTNPQSERRRPWGMRSSNSTTRNQARADPAGYSVAHQQSTAQRAERDASSSETYIREQQTGQTGQTSQQTRPKKTRRRNRRPRDSTAPQSSTTT